MNHFLKSEDVLIRRKKRELLTANAGRVQEEERGRVFLLSFILNERVRNNYCTVITRLELLFIFQEYAIVIKLDQSFKNWALLEFAPRIKNFPFQ